MEESASWNDTNAAHQEEGEQPPILDIMAMLQVLRESHNELLTGVNLL